MALLSSTKVVRLALITSAFAMVAGSALARVPAPARRVTVAASGDILLHIKVVKAAAAHGWDHVFDGLRQTLRADEIAMANLETPLVEDVREVRTGSPPILGAPSAAAAALGRAGVDVLACANNHAYDQRSIGMARTVQAVRAAGMVAVGADAEEEAAYAHHLVERDGVRVAFLSYTERINAAPGRPIAAHVAWTKRRGLETALRAARRDADVVVLGIHWSHDFVWTPRHGQRRRAREWAELGADLIVGTGPHVLQEVERVPTSRGESVVAYSLGNLISNQGKRYRVGRRISRQAHPALRLAETRDGVVLRTRFAVRPGGIEVEALRATPLWTRNNFWDLALRGARDYDIQVAPLSQVDAPTRHARREAIRSALGTAVVLDPEVVLDPASSEVAPVSESGS